MMVLCVEWLCDVTVVVFVKLEFADPAEPPSAASPSAAPLNAESLELDTLETVEFDPPAASAAAAPAAPPASLEFDPAAATAASLLEFDAVPVEDPPAAVSAVQATLDVVKCVEYQLPLVEVAKEPPVPLEVKEVIVAPATTGAGVMTGMEVVLSAIMEDMREEVSIGVVAAAKTEVDVAVLLSVVLV